MSELVTDADVQSLRRFVGPGSPSWHDIDRLLHTRSALIEALERVEPVLMPNYALGQVLRSKIGLEKSESERLIEDIRQLLSTIHATEGNERRKHIARTALSSTEDRRASE